MARLVDELSKNPHAVNVSEIPNVGHWFNGVVDDPILQKFFNAHYSTALPQLPVNFTVVTLNPATSEGRGGIRILQLITPYRAGRIFVQQSNTGTWILTTENVRRFGFYVLPPNVPQNFKIDGQPGIFNYVTMPGAHLCFLMGMWQTCADNGAWQTQERGPLSYGPIEQVLRGPLTIVYGTQDALADYRLDLAVYMANVLYYQSRYSIQILSDMQANPSTTANVILLGGPTTNAFSQKIAASLPVSFNGSTFTVGPRTFSSPATGIAFLAAYSYITAPAYGANLCAVLEGTDEAGLLKAVQLFPIVSTVTTPDFAVAGPQWGSNGGAGLLALGFWNNTWQYDPLIGYITTMPISF